MCFTLRQGVNSKTYAKDWVSCNGWKGEHFGSKCQQDEPLECSESLATLESILITQTMSRLLVLFKLEVYNCVCVRACVHGVGV